MQEKGSQFTAHLPKQKEEAISAVRGGSICEPGSGGANLIRGSNAPAVCATTPGFDPRPRWRVAGKHRT